MPYCCMEIGRYFTFECAHFWQYASLFAPTPGENQRGAYSCGSGGLYVRDRIADQMRAGQIEPKLCLRTQQKTWRRLSTFAAILGMVPAHVPGVDAPPVCLNLGSQAL